ncbi:hypothetical protein EYW49_21250 [Siculibacillus lacustris]|uniref:Uncharacterized protein n=1 Tax=Siculibacillus lacustris TaxID=1549641 RepID=A0A4V2KSI4_9HYPH|nr:DUF6634 family protein [Siculibacillus lacustris]TBW32922.1 hypothetical protein EYW49_21250 [Siculibacillus lacustris]
MSIRFLADPTDVVLHLRCLADDIENLVLEGGPSASTLSMAPVLDEWEAIPRLDVCLTGEVSHHPRFGTHSEIATSGLWAIDEAAGWARTLSRYYRLGRRVASTHGEC